MFVIEMRNPLLLDSDTTGGRWVPFWRSQDGLATVNYLRDLTELRRPCVEYRMVYELPTPGVNV